MKPRPKTRPPLLEALARRFRALPLSRKLATLVVGVSLSIAGLAMAASFVIELNLFRQRLLQEYQSTARMLASNLEAAIAFEDANDAQDILDLLAERHHTTAAAAYLANGIPLATYQRSGPGPAEPPPDPHSPSRIADTRLVATAPVFLNDQVIGHVALAADLLEIRSFILARLAIYSLLLILASGISIYLAARFGRAIARPIMDLANTAKRISRDQDYSTRHQRLTDDETGHLVDAFNAMIAEIARREESLLVAKEKAEASSRAKDDFLSVISHELRTPLNPIIGYVEILLKQRVEGTESKQLRLIKNSAEHLQGIIDDILDYSRVERGVFAIAREPIDYQDLCQDVVSLLAPEATRKGLALSASHQRQPDSLPPSLVVYSDRTRLRQILLNLVANAVKFTPKGSISIQTELAQTGPSRAKIRFQVTDTGIGIAPEDHDKVFQPFSQIDESLTRQYSGMGLGLAISLKIAHALDGVLDFDSVKGAGSRFWLDLQLDVAPTPEPAAPEPAPTPPPPAGRILLVDDQLVNRELAESLLTGCGQQVVCAKDGFDALEKARDEVFALVIMDIKMPRMDGYEAARRLREIEAARGTRTPIIAMTAHVTTRGNQDSVAAGMDDFLPKPFNTAKLNVILQKWLAPP